MDEQWNCDKEKRRLRPLYGILLFVFVMISYYTIIAWAQMRWGMYGLALTELYLLVLSILGAKLMRVPLKEMFPVKKPQWMKIFAVLLMWIASYSAVLPLTMTVAYFFPKQMFSVSGELNEFVASVPVLVSVFISCVMPAVCEEALHRGFILKSFQSRWQNKWVLSILMGLIFGLFHGSVWRFIPTALLGFSLTYLMVETENMVYPALFHFINNFIPSLMSGFSAGDAQTEAAAQLLIERGLPLSFLGIYIGMACVAPFGFYTASYLLRKGEEGKEQRYITSNKVLILLVVFTVLLILLGMFLFIYGLFYDNFLRDFLPEMSGNNLAVLTGIFTEI